MAGGGFSGHGLNLRMERKTRSREECCLLPTRGWLGWLGFQPVEFGWNRVGGGGGVGEAIIPKTPFDGLRVGEGESAPATPAFVK